MPQTGTSPIFDAVPTDGPEAVLTANQVAKLLNISVDKLLPMVARGEGPPALRVGRTYRFRPSSLARWQAELEREHTARTVTA